MARKRHKAREIVNKLRQADVELGKGSKCVDLVSGIRKIILVMSGCIEHSKRKHAASW